MADSNLERTRRIARALSTAAAGFESRQLSEVQAIAILAAAAADRDCERTPRELAKAGRQGHRASVMAAMGRLEREGKGRKAAGILAKANAADRLDPVEMDTLRDKYRRWRREEKRKHANARFGSSR